MKAEREASVVSAHRPQQEELSKKAEEENPSRQTLASRH